MRITHLAGAFAAALGLTASTLAQDAQTTTTSAEELLKALEAAGVDVSAITSLNDDGTVTVDLPAPPADEATAAEAERLEQEAKELSQDAAGVEAESEVEWDYKLTLGFAYSDGNTENASFSGAFVATREIEDVSKLTFDAAYFYSQENNNTSDNKFTAGGNYDWYFHEKWFWFIRGRYDYDQFRSWDHRVSGATGVGYRWVDTDDFKFTTRAGAGAFKEFGSNRNEIVPEGLLAAELEWNLTENQSITASSTYHPSFKSIDDFRLVNRVAYNAKINHADGLSFSVGFLHEHESIVDPGVERNDFKLFGGLTFDF